LIFTNLSQREEVNLSGGQIISAVGSAGSGRGTRSRVIGGSGSGVVIIVADFLTQVMPQIQ